MNLPIATMMYITYLAFSKLLKRFYANRYYIYYPESALLTERRMILSRIYGSVWHKARQTYPLKVDSAWARWSGAVIQGRGSKEKCFEVFLVSVSCDYSDTGQTAVGHSVRFYPHASI